MAESERVRWANELGEKNPKILALRNTIDALREQLLSNPHSPGQYRAFVPLANNDAFMRAFNVQPGDRMYRAPADRVRIW